jgi:hypothetical protein
LTVKSKTDLAGVPDPDGSVWILAPGSGSALIIRIQIPPIAMRLAKMYIFYTDPDPQLFINVSVPSDPILIKKGKN